MVDRIEKLDPKLYRVQESAEDRERRQQREREEEEREKDRDEFDRGRPFWKKLIPEATIKTPLAAPPQWRGEGEEREVFVDTGKEVTLSRRVLVLWGILDLEGRPRIPVIATYIVVISVITVSAFLILGILWR